MKMRYSLASVIVAFFLVQASITYADVIPPSHPVGGVWQDELTGEWWQWVANYPPPPAPHPLFDTTGALSHLGDINDQLFFLAGSFSPDPVTRTVTVMVGQDIFFPLVNAFYFDETSSLTEQFMRDYLAPEFDGVDQLFAQVDGVDVPVDLFDHRQLSPLFLLDVTAGSFWHDPPTVPVGQFASVSDGFWLGLRGLTPGNHTLHFGGRFGPNSPDFAGFSQDITYLVTVMCTVAVEDKSWSAIKGLYR